MASTSSSTLTLSSSSTLVSPQSPAASPQCVSLPPPPPVPSHTRPSKATSFCRKIARNVMGMATTREAPAAALEVATTTTEYVEPPEIVKSIQKAWDKVEDKYAVSSLAVAAGVALVGSAGMISAIDRIPFIPGLLEVVGIGYTGYFAYKNLFFKPDRVAFVQKVKETYAEIIGSSA